MNDYDVIVIGAGGAGLAAAAMAASRGSRVLVVEAGDSAGGSTAMSARCLLCGGHAGSACQGIVGDTPDAMFHYYMTLNQYKLEASLVRRLCDEAPEALEWLISLAVSFPVANLYVAGVDKVARGHRAEGMGLEIATALEGACNRHGVDLVLRTRVRELIVENGAVRGIRVDGDELRSSAVVLATGGFGANPELLARLLPRRRTPGRPRVVHRFEALPWRRPADGQAVGAQLYGHNRGLLLVTPGFARDLEVYLPGWLVYVNREGRRFVDETIEYSVLAAVLKEQVGGECFAIFDEASRGSTQRGSAAGGELDRGPACGADRRGQNHSSCQRCVNLRTPSACAPERSRPRSRAITSIVQPATMRCGSSRRTRCARCGRHRFHAVRIRPAIVCWTGTGLRIDRDGARARCVGASDRRSLRRRRDDGWRVR
jgi:fumarate reductase flavoprotein subunit